MPPTPSDVSDLQRVSFLDRIVAFVVLAALLLGNAWLKRYLMAVQPMGITASMAPYVAYSIGFAILGVGMGWRAARPARIETGTTISTARAIAVCVAMCVAVALFSAWLLG